MRITTICKSLVILVLALASFAPVIAAESASPTTPPAKEQTQSFWLTQSSGIRHNSKCRYFHNSKGRPCEKSEGRACKLCGG